MFGVYIRTYMRGWIACVEEKLPPQCHCRIDNTWSMGGFIHGLNVYHVVAA